MLRTTVSKIRHVCALAYFVPRLLRGNIRIPGRFEKLSVSVQRRVDKSTDSGPNESDYERCQRIIDRAFSPNPPHTYYIPDPNSKHKQSFMNLVTPEMPTGPESQCEKCQRIINQIFGEDSNAGDKKRDIVDPVCIPLTELQATTAKENPETLAQKVEVIDETPMVEAAAKPKIEGFNLHPKVLGNKRRRRTLDKSPILNYSCDKNGRRKGTSRKDSSFDELAKRCLDSPSGQIDERLLKEMEKLGVPPSSRRGSRKTASDSGIVQPEIMRRPRRPVEKTELDFLTKMERLRELERLNDDLPPPFELIPVKTNSVNLSSSCETEDNTLYVERIQPYHLTDRIEVLPENTPIEEDFTTSSSEYNNEKPPQRLLGHMTATVMSNDSNVMTDKSNEIEHLIVRQERLKPSHLNDNSAVGSNVDSRTDEKISLAKLKQTEEENTAISREKLATTNLLSEMVDPNDISPQTTQTNFIKEYKEIETLRNLLQTRLEHLTNSSTKSRKFKEHSTEFYEDSSAYIDSKAQDQESAETIRSDFSKDSSPLIDAEVDDQRSAATLRVERMEPHRLKEDPNIICKELSPHTEPGILIRETTKSKVTKETADKNVLFRGYLPDQTPVTAHQLLEQISLISKETSPFMDAEAEEHDTATLRVERIEPHRLKEDPNIICKELSPHTEPGILIRETTKSDVIKETADKNVLYKSYLPDQTPVTAHQLFEQISLISRETELGTIDDYPETDYNRSDKVTPSELMDSVGVVCKNEVPSKQPELPADNNTQNVISDSYKRNIHDCSPLNYEYNLIENADCAIKLLQNTLLTPSELSRRALTEEETDEPVIAVEMGRIESAASQEQPKDPNVLVSALNSEPGVDQFSAHNEYVSPLNREPNRDQLTDYNVVASGLNREPVLQETDESNTVAPETLLNPLLGKGTVAHVGTENINANDDMSTTLPKEHPPKPLTLSEMLKRVRERNRMEHFKEFVELKMQSTQVDPVVGECGKKQPPCPPAAPTCPPPPKPPCPPKKPPCPNPCKPKCPPTCPPAPCGEPKTKCPPEKKSPCDKFQKTKCSCVTVQDALTLLLYLGPQFHIPHKSMLPIITCALNFNTSLQDSKAKAIEHMLTKLQDLYSFIFTASFRDVDDLETIGVGTEGATYAKTYDPWSPIPSWPIPVKEEKKKLVCPKEGCKVIPPKLNAPCRDINPCAHLPRHNKFTMIDFININ